MRLIDADEIKYQLLIPNTNPTLWCVSKDAVDWIPTVDAVPVVRCGKCIHSRLDEDDGLICQMHYLPTAEENFCSYGETWEEPEINPCRGCKDYDWNGGCKSNGGCGMDLNDTDINVRSKTDEVTE